MPRTKHILESVHRAHNFPLGETRQHTGEPSKEVLSLPWYHLVPKDPVKQIGWRLEIRKRGFGDKEFRHSILQACEEDVLFFANALCWVFEPRKPATLPLNSWANQDDHIVWMDECFGKRDLGCDKSRDQSISWDALVMSYRHWRFDEVCKMALVSLSEEKVDSLEDSDTLIWKLNFLHENMPEWFRCDRKGQDILGRTVSDHRFHNRLKNSTYTGYACTGNVTRGGRKIWGFMDEYAEWPNHQQQRALDATQFAIKSRCIVSTFTGDSDRFFQIMRQEKSTMLKVIADWKDNPEQKKGLYTSSGGHLIKLDKEYIFPPDYPFVLDGKTRSPYYDAECNRPGATPQSIARELDRDPQGATSKIFSPSVLIKARAACREPYFRGNLDFNTVDFEPVWVPDDNGRMFVWKDMQEVHEFDKTRWKLGYGGPYAVGCDIGAGSGSSETSNSSIEVIDIPSGEQVLEYFSHMIRPKDFAQLAYVVCKWLCVGHDLSWAYLNWESQGIGEAFTTEIVRLEWYNCYKTKSETTVYQERSEKLGHHNSDGGYNSLCELQRAIQSDETTIRSEKVVFECGQYELGRAGTHSGKCIHVGSKTSGDASAQGKSHGDCAIGYALAWMAARDRPLDKEAVISGDPEDAFLKELEAKLLKPANSHVLGWSQDHEDYRNAS